MRLGQEQSGWLTLKGSIPQGSWLGAPLYRIHRQFTALFIMHRYMDDATLTAPVQKGSSGSMQSYINQAVSWYTTNKMIPNVDKTNDMVISFHKQPIIIPPITLEGVEIERVKSVKLLGIIVTNKITWDVNATYICSEASMLLYYLKQLRRAGLDSDDLLAFYGSVIRPGASFTNN